MLTHTHTHTHTPHTHTHTHTQLHTHTHTHTTTHTKLHDVDTILPVCPMKDPWSWSLMSAKITDTDCLKNFCQSVQKQQQEEKWEERKEKPRSKQSIDMVDHSHMNKKNQTVVIMDVQL